MLTIPLKTHLQTSPHFGLCLMYSLFFVFVSEHTVCENKQLFKYMGLFDIIMVAPRAT